MIASRKYHSFLSKAFSISILRNINPPLFFVLEKVQQLMSKNIIVLNISAKHKSRLKGENNLREHHFQLVGKNFCNDFIDNIA